MCVCVFLTPMAGSEPVQHSVWETHTHTTALSPCGQRALWLQRGSYKERRTKSGRWRGSVRHSCCSNGHSVSPSSPPLPPIHLFLEHTSQPPSARFGHKCTSEKRQKAVWYRIAGDLCTFQSNLLIFFKSIGSWKYSLHHQAQEQRWKEGEIIM